jgi:transcriptional regulator with XRE-family HTH domain
MFEHLGLTIRLLRELRELKQAALARKAGIGKSQLSKYENGRELPKLLALQKLLAALEMSFLDFAHTLDWVNSQQPEFGRARSLSALPASRLLTSAVQAGFEDLQTVLLRLHQAVMESSLPKLPEHSPENS